jgi:hypothetical protein
MQIQDDARPWYNNALLWGSVATAVWVLALVAASLVRPHGCVTDTTGKPLFVGCLTPNEVGDLFAGAFAPIAFLWLVVAVIVQSQELASQRKELALTRREFELNRDVAQAQAHQIAEQTLLLRREREQAEQTAVDHEINERLSRLISWIKQGYPFYAFRFDNGLYQNQWLHDQLSDELNFALADFFARIREARKALCDGQAQITGGDRLVELQRRIRPILELTERASPMTRQFISVDADMDTAAQDIEAMLALVEPSF